MPVFTRVVVGCDHSAVATREEVLKFLAGLGTVEVVDCGVKTADRVDYPDVAALVCARVNEAPGVSCGVLIDGAGIGSGMAANKCAGIRAAVCHDYWSATMTRKHNDANVLCVGSRNMGPDVITQMVGTFVGTEFEGGRHMGRIEKLMDLDRTRGQARQAQAQGNGDARMEEAPAHAHAQYPAPYRTPIQWEGGGASGALVAQAPVPAPAAPAVPAGNNKMPGYIRFHIQ